MKNFFKSALAKALGVLALILVGVMIYSATTGGLATIPETLAGIFVTPLQSATTGVSNGFSDFFGWLTGGDDVRQQLEALKSHMIYNGLNMTKIESRPIPGKTWEYRFFIDFEGNLDSSAVKNAIRGLAAEANTMRVLGNYELQEEV